VAWGADVNVRVVGGRAVVAVTGGGGCDLGSAVRVRRVGVRRVEGGVRVAATLYWAAACVLRPA